RIAQAVRELLAAALPADLMPRRAKRLERAFGWRLYLDAHEAAYLRCRAVQPCTGPEPARAQAPLQ
ncbi:MAG TPA: hypothetical protein VFZ93_02125, partial [Albitalea sp.]